MADKTLRKATAERQGCLIVIRMTGGPDCLWLNMYLDALEKQMTCDSDIGFYAYHWGRNANMEQGFVQFCINWLADDNWLLRKCIGERHISKCFDYKKTSQALVKAYKEETMDEDETDCTHTSLKKHFPGLHSMTIPMFLRLYCKRKRTVWALTYLKNGGSALNATIPPGRNDLRKFAGKSLCLSWNGLRRRRHYENP